MGKNAVRGLRESVTWAAINWQNWLLAGIWLTIAVVAVLAFQLAAVRQQLPVILLILASTIGAASLVLSRFYTRRCVTCGIPANGLAWEFDDCPNCHRPYFAATDLLKGKDALSLSKATADERRPSVKLFGMVVMLALRDRANQIRLVGHKVDDAAEYPWATPCGSWDIWIRVNDDEYRMVPPPRHLGATVFEMLRETYRRTEKERLNGPANFPITLGDWSGDVQLVLEESETERVASMVLPAGSEELRNAAASHLQQMFKRRDDRTGSYLPRAATWKRLPRFIPRIPRRALIGLTSIAWFTAIASLFVVLQTGDWSGQSLSDVVMTASSLVFFVGLALLGIRRECRCGTMLAVYSDDAVPIWCPECRAVFDPAKRGLPMDGSRLDLKELRACRDPHAVWLVPLLDYALDCQKEQVTFFDKKGAVSARLSKTDADAVELQVVDSWLCLELMAEFDRRSREKTGGDRATFMVVGSLREASATLELGESDGTRTATLNLEYGTVGRS